MAAYDYDLIVIGSGPAGQRAAIQAAKLDKSVAVLERLPLLGGVGDYIHRYTRQGGGRAGAAGGGDGQATMQASVS